MPRKTVSITVDTNKSLKTAGNVARTAGRGAKTYAKAATAPSRAVAKGQVAVGKAAAKGVVSANKAAVKGAKTVAGVVSGAMPKVKISIGNSGPSKKDVAMAKEQAKQADMRRRQEMAAKKSSAAEKRRAARNAASKSEGTPSRFTG